MAEWSEQHPLWAMVGPSTAFGREVLGRLAALLGAGLVGDAIALSIVEGELVAAKPAFSGALVADITCTSGVRLVSVRPGVLPLLPPARIRPTSLVADYAPQPSASRGWPTDDDIETLARADVVIGLGAGVQPDQYEELSPWPRCSAPSGGHPESHRQRLGSSIPPGGNHRGKHLPAALRGRRSKWEVQPHGWCALGRAVVAINHDPDAPVFAQCDVGIVGDWHEVVPALASALRNQARPFSRAGG